MQEQAEILLKGAHHFGDSELEQGAAAGIRGTRPRGNVRDNCRNSPGEQDAE
jgi:hypothetical protein